MRVVTTTWRRFLLQWNQLLLDLDEMGIVDFDEDPDDLVIPTGS